MKTVFHFFYGAVILILKGLFILSVAVPLIVALIIGLFIDCAINQGERGKG